MIETVRWFLVDRGLERGCSFMIKLNLLDNMRVDLVFNRLRRDPRRVLDAERRASAVSDNANPIHAQERAATVFFVVGLIFNSAKRFPRQKRAQLSHGRPGQLVL